MSKNTLTLREAAKAAGKGTAAIKAAIESGKLSASGGGKDPDGKNIPYQIDASELHRVFGLRVNSSTGEIETARTPKNTEEQVSLSAPVGALASVLEAKLQAAELMLAETQRNLDRERERADRAEAERRALLEAPREEALRERQERERERAEALQRDQERRAEAERLRADLDRERQERDRLAREAEELRQVLLKPKGLWARITGR